ncbi:MBL fold metallo-hydrolase [Bradyrhizobium tropiciagri]|uniref:MBL fold metallo-hydrolase n=1 Tax=Bradyrhizobium tropiciagri TaxID=312253 RepID=UPI00067DB83C|nr:MBL fold metallo-hydrolase [Bradyrhizobium tropiciagri]
MKAQFFGDIRVDSIREFDFAIEPGWLFPGVTPEDVAEHEHWLGPQLVEPGTRNLKVLSHAYLIRTRHHTILFDTCCGNDKDAPESPWHRLRMPFLENLARVGVLPEQVDFVMCSHLHADHFGWNTRLQNGEWVPTFPNARYLMSKGEFKWWREAIVTGVGVKPHRKQPWTESVLPVVERGLATFVEDDHAVENEMPDELRYMPLHGHTKHHCGLYLRSGQKDAIFSGDAIHHPIQFTRPDWINASYDPAAATQTLRDLIARCIDTSTKLMTAHFTTPTGWVVSEAGQVRFRFDAD